MVIARINIYIKIFIKNIRIFVKILEYDTTMDLISSDLPPNFVWGDHKLLPPLKTKLRNLIVEKSFQEMTILSITLSRDHWAETHRSLDWTEI